MREEDLAASNVLDPDERVIWSGQPQQGPSGLSQWTDFAAGWVFAIGLSVAATTKGIDLLSDHGTACQPAARCTPYSTFGWIFLIGASLILYVALRISISSLRQRRTVKTESYAITDRRALLFRTAKGRTTVRSIPVCADLWLSYVPGLGGEIGLSRMIQGESDDGSNAYDEEMVVFRNLEDPDIPYRVLRDIQNRRK